MRTSTTTDTPRRRAFARSASVAALAAASIALAAATARGAATVRGAAAGQEHSAREVVRRVGFDQKLDSQVPLDLVFRDEDGAEVRLGDLFGDRPVVLTLVYYECPMMCTQVLNALVGALRAVDHEPGRDFEIVTLTIDPRETPDLARTKKARYLREWGRQDAADGWRFLSPRGVDRAEDEASIARLADSVGFRYVYYPELDEFAHASGFVVLTPQGRVAKYFYGVEYEPRDLELALVESSNGRIGTLVDQVLLLCYHYDPTTGKYGVAIMSAIRLLGGLTVAAIAAFVVVALRRERAAARVAAGGT